MTRNRREILLDALHEHQSSLLRYARSIAGDEEIAQEIVQEVFLRLWKADLKKIQSHLAPWLFHVCRNLALDRIRRRQKVIPISEAHREKPAEGISQYESVERQQSVARVMHYISDLPEKHQELVRLRFQGDLSYKEIALAMEMSVNHVGVTLHKIMLKLRDKMTAEDKGSDAKRRS